MQGTQTTNVGWPVAIEYYRNVTPLDLYEEAEERWQSRELHRRYERPIWYLILGFPVGVVGVVLGEWRSAAMIFREWRDVRNQRRR